ncbi:Nif3-like dinuclear metal center hexameric protein [Syntrophomonas erecta]
MQVRVKDLITIMNKHFPPCLAENWDNVGLQVGSYEQKVDKVLVALEVDREVAERAIAEGMDLIITHHPLIFKPLKCIVDNSFPGDVIQKLIKANISVFSAHTNLDAAPYGLSQLLAEYFALRNIEPLDKGSSEELFKLVVFVPTTHLEMVRAAVNKAGAGYIGNYSDCSFRMAGVGTFCPREGTHPFIGKQGVVEEVDEYRLETIVYQSDLSKVIRAMEAVHPYEEVAYDIYPLANQGRVFSLGRLGRLEKEIRVKDYADLVKEKLGVNNLRLVGDPQQLVKKVAVVSGAGASFIKRAAFRGADLLITGDVKYHEAREALELGLCVLDIGHQASEEMVVPYLAKLLDDECSQIGGKISVKTQFLRPGFTDI